ncbi:glutaredoxin family protein [Chitiniphilus purpureus]|uniref:Glutaredoxin family protein n=1 Tax=Chitiniphilus purpureus TaxID=2981137 RepID=A0ABY6DLK2_9NEIS|nr:glutaredoxin family protein [Chitiniphilus sp. CD1]UXY15226.1 glutaredoxin family protein [Chitiniphilus sp. CD1]
MNRVFMPLLALFGAYLVWGYFSGTGQADVPGEAQIRELAATVRPDEVVMYSTTECGYCAQAKSWLQQYGFAFTECNMSVEARCVREFGQYGATGTPYLVIRRAGKEHHMKDGFDSDEFLAAL